MNPFYFGDSVRPLFGVHHPPRTRTGRERAVVLCYPFGQEYMRAHRAFRQLALLLSKAGAHVLRFDFGATGDSAGDSEEGSIARWTEDLGVAIDELRDTAGVRSITVVGLRLGAAIALLGARARPEVEQIILWDPIVRGDAYLRDMLGSAKAPRDDETIGIMGFPLTPAFRRELAGMDLLADGTACRPPVLITASNEHADFARLREHLAATGATAALRVIPSPGNWNEVDKWGSALIPHAIIQGIVGALIREDA